MKEREGGKWLPGVSGNPSGKCLDGSTPKHEAPAQEAKAVVAIAIEEQRAEVERIYLEAAPELMKLAIQRAKKDNRILAILIEKLVPNMSRAPQEPSNRTRAQLEFDFMRLVEEAKGGNGATQNPLSSLYVPGERAAEVQVNDTETTN